MSRPVLLAVDDDPDVLRAVERDLRSRYSDRYRVLTANSGEAALDLLRRVAQRKEPVALLVVDHRMPNMNGIEFLTVAIQEWPDVRRVLLTAYADTEAAIRVEPAAVGSAMSKHLPHATKGLKVGGPGRVSREGAENTAHVKLSGVDRAREPPRRVARQAGAHGTVSCRRRLPCRGLASR